jgi:hypothetical protein
VVAIVIVIGLMLVVGNYGILARFRPIALVVLLPLAAIGTARSRFRSAVDPTAYRATRVRG